MVNKLSCSVNSEGSFKVNDMVHDFRGPREDQKSQQSAQKVVPQVFQFFQSCSHTHGVKVSVFGVFLVRIFPDLD